MTENGQLLIAKQFIPEQPVIKIRVLNAIPPKRAKFPALTVPKLSELLIIYESTVVSVDSNVLMSCLISNRAEAVQARSKETSFSNGNLPARKWKVRLFMVPSIGDVGKFSRFLTPTLLRRQFFTTINQQI